jgi:HK97 family phage major capsid protein
MVLAAKTIEDFNKVMNTMNEKLTNLENSRKSAEGETISAILRGGYIPVGRTSDEERALKFFGCSHPSQLIQINTMHPRFRNVPAEIKQTVIDLKEAVSIARFTSQMFHGEKLDRIGASAEMDRVAKVKGMLDHRYGRDELAPRLKAFGSTVSTGGDEWVPTLISAQYIEEFQLDRVVEDKFQEIPLASAPFDLPTQGGSTKARKIAENTAITGNNFTTGKITFTPVKSGEYYIIPEELNEDSAVAIYQIGTREVVEAQRRAIEAAILNGDDDGTHLDSDTQALGSDVAEKFWKGLRRQAIANSANGGTTDFGNAAISETNLRTMRQRMKKFGVNPRQLLWIVDPVSLQQMLGLSSVSTMEKYGSMATVVTGELARYQGIPIVTSEYMRSDLNATGVYDGVTVNRTALLLVNTSRWYVGMRRPIRVKIMEDLPNQDRWLLASYQRKDFQGFTQSATEVSVSYGYNVAV